MVVEVVAPIEVVLVQIGCGGYGGGGDGADC